MLNARRKDQSYSYREKHLRSAVGSPLSCNFSTRRVYASGTFWRLPRRELAGYVRLSQALEEALVGPLMFVPLESSELGDKVML